MTTTATETVLQKLVEIAAELELCISATASMTKHSRFQQPSYKKALSSLQELERNWKDVNHPIVPLIEKAAALMSGDSGPSRAAGEIREAIAYLNKSK